ncbi:protein FAM98A [Bombyx mori]|uniref:Protein FAM98A n=1 Tax=Bombyx mori TaxID=7091 RepID=A0A8R2R9G0_BOMMO|nr:protein FAM98A [Bombyx mori]
MENEILDSLSDLSYEGPLSEEAVFAKAIEGGAKSLDFTKLVHILAEELKNLCHLEETVNMINDPDDSSSFLLELSSFLKELGCPYKKLVTGHMSSRLQSKDDRLLLLDYLISELMAARMVNVDRPQDKGSGMEIVMRESPTAKDLKDILITLKFNKPPPNITPEVLFSKLEGKLKDTIQKEGEQLVGKPLYNKALSDKDWKQLETSFTEMFEEYRLRRETLITRLECTIQSFEWSDRLKTQKDAIQSTYRPKREHLKPKPDVKLSDFLAARTSLLQVEKTSSATVRKNTRSDVNKVLIGQVPDRGGRPNEQQPPPPEMPSWQQRSSAPSGGGRGGGGRGGRGGEGGRGGRGAEGGRGGRGGRVQGGYAQTTGDSRPQSSQSGYNGQNQRKFQTYEVPPGGYDQNRGRYESNQSGYSSNQSGYNSNQSGYTSNQSGYTSNQSGYNSNRSSLDLNRSGYDSNRSSFDNSRGSQGGGYTQGYGGGYQTYDSLGNYSQGGGNPGYRTQNYSGSSGRARGGYRTSR